LSNRMSDKGRDSGGKVIWRGVSGGWVGHNVRSLNCVQSNHPLSMYFGLPTCWSKTLHPVITQSKALNRSSCKFCAICRLGCTGSK
jgi:hypothetical protein